MSLAEGSTWARQRKAVLWAAVAGYLPAALLVAVIAVVAGRKGIPIGNITREPAAIMDAPFYIGALNHLGVMLWCAAAAICYLSYALLKGRADRDMRLFFLVSGLGTTALVFDNVFQFHDVVYPWLLHLPERGVFAIYLAATLVYLVRFRGTIRRTPFLIMFFSGFLFTVKIGADQFLHVAQQHLLEDGPKFVGIAGWLAYVAITSLEQTREPAAGVLRAIPDQRARP